MTRKTLTRVTLTRAEARIVRELLYQVDNDDYTDRHDILLERIIELIGAV